MKKSRRCPILPQGAGWRLAAIAGLLALAVADFAPAVARADKPAIGGTPAAATAPLAIPTSSTRPEVKGIEKDTCFEIDEIVVTGIVLVEPREVERAVRPLAWRCMGNLLAKAVIGAVNEVYAAHGYVTTQGYVKPQDIKTSRRLEIAVIAGRIGRIVTREHDDDPTPSSAFARLRAAKGPWGVLSGLSALANSLGIWLQREQILGAGTFPRLKTLLATPSREGDVLDLDRLQQGADQLNLSPSQRASVKLEPGAEPGTSDVIVDLPRTRSFRLGVGYELNGSALGASPLNGQQVVPARARVDIAKDNLFGLNDNWSTTFASSLQSNEASAALVAPAGWFTLALNASYGEYFSILAPNVVFFQQIVTTALNASTVIARDREQLTRVTAGLTVRQATRFIDIVPLDPQDVAFTRLGLLQTRFYDTAQLTFGGGWSHGLQALGATVDNANADYSVPRAQFDKIDALASFTQIVKPYGALRFDTAGQYSPTALYQQDQLLLGSVTTVRGFAEAPGFVDSGFILRSEFAAAPPIKDWLGDRARDQLFYWDVASALSPYVFCDLGGGYNVANSETVARLGAGAGLRYSLGRLTFDGSIAKPLAGSGALPAAGFVGFEAYLNLTISLF